MIGIRIVNTAVAASCAVVLLMGVALGRATGGIISGSGSIVTQAIVGSALFASAAHAAHLVSSWWMFYANRPFRESLGERKFQSRIVRAPLLYVVTIFFVISLAYFSLGAPELAKGIFLFLAFGPHQAHHAVAQDRGIFTIADRLEASEHGKWFRLVAVPVLLVAVAYVQAINALRVGSYIDLPTSVIHVRIGCVAGLMVCAAMAIHVFRGGQFRFFALAHTFSVAAWFLGYVFVGMGFVAVFYLVFSLRHHVYYFLLVWKYFSGRRRSGDCGVGASFFERILVRSGSGYLWVTAALSLIMTGFYFFSLFGDLVLARLAIDVWWASWATGISYAVIGAAITLHFDLDRFPWRFSQPALRPRLDRYLLDAEERAR